MNINPANNPEMNALRCMDNQYYMLFIKIVVRAKFLNSLGLAVLPSARHDTYLIAELPSP